MIFRSLPGPSPAWLFSLLLASSCAGFGPQAPRDTAGVDGAEGIQGLLTAGGRPLEGASVYAYRSASAGLLGPADFASAPTGADGMYRIDLVRGAYHLVARKRVSGGDSGPLAAGDLVGLPPSNPVSVEEGKVERIDFALAPLRDPMSLRNLSRRAAGTGIRGTITDIEGRPAASVFAMAYDSPDLKRVPGWTSGMTGEDGRFVIYLPRGGTYWVAARGNMRSRPAAGEPYGVYAGSSDGSITVPEGGFVGGIVIRLAPYRPGGN